MLEDLTPPDRTRKCKMGRIMDSLEDSDRVILQKALDNPEVWAAKTLARELTVRGLSITEGPLGLHRNHSCGCFR